MTNSRPLLPATLFPPVVVPKAEIGMSKILSTIERRRRKQQRRATRRRFYESPFPAGKLSDIYLFIFLSFIGHFVFIFLSFFRHFFIYLCQFFRTFFKLIFFFFYFFGHFLKSRNQFVCTQSQHWR
jgi:amino acid permease